MTYAVKEIYRTLQGEGVHAGRASIFLRFAGCNMWSGRPEDRGKGPGSCSAWCDTDFVGGERLAAPEVARRCAEAWGPGRDRRWVVCTGGEPLLQLDGVMVDTLRRFGFSIAVETNGTLPLPCGVDWLTVSPKAGAATVVTAGDELKLVYPQAGQDPAAFAAWPFAHFLLQPMDGPDLTENTRAAIAYCYANPKWRLGIQMHKCVGLR